MTHDPPAADLSALSEIAFWEKYHAAAAARDHRAWAACGAEFARRYGAVAWEPCGALAGDPFARLGPRVFRLWEAAQTLYRGLPDPPTRTAPPPATELDRFRPRWSVGGPCLAWATDAAFADEVLNVAGRVVVLLYAAWSGPDHMLLRWLRDHVAAYPGVKFVAVWEDEGTDTRIRYDAPVTPTLLAFEGGQEVGRLVGYPGSSGAEWFRSFDALAGRPPAAG